MNNKLFKKIIGSMGYKLVDKKLIKIFIWRCTKKIVRKHNFYNVLLYLLINIKLRYFHIKYLIPLSRILPISLGLTKNTYILTVNKYNVIDPLK